MTWDVINVGDVESALNDGELDAWRQHAAQIADPLPGIVEQVTGLVRGYVAVRYKLTDPGIPSELKAPAIDLVIYRLAMRVNTGGDADVRRKDAADDAMKVLQDVAKGLFGDFENRGQSDGVQWGSETKFSPR